MMLDVTRTEIEREVKRALPACGDLTTCHPLIKGHGHQSFVLETSSKANLLLKIALRTDQLGKMRSLRQVLELAAGHHIPAPKLLYFSEGTSSFAGRPWLIQEFLTGQDGEEAIAGMSELQRMSFFHDFGKAVSRLHTVNVGYFSEDLACSRRELTWASVVESRLERLKANHLQARLLPRQSIESARQAIVSDVCAISLTYALPWCIAISTFQTLWLLPAAFSVSLISNTRVPLMPYPAFLSSRRWSLT